MRWVSAIGQSHAVSMCAWPIACTSCATGAFGVARSSRRMAAASGQVARSSSRQTLQNRFSSRSSTPAHVGSSPLAWSASSSCSTAKSVYRAACLPVVARDAARVEEEGRDRGVRTASPRRTRRCRPPPARAPAARRRRPRHQQRVGPVPLPARVESLGGAPVQPEGGLRVRRPEQVDALARPRLRHRRGRRRNQKVAHCGPSCSPSSTGRYSSRRAASRPMRSVGPAIRMRSAARRSRCASPASRRAVCRRRSRV